MAFFKGKRLTAGLAGEPPVGLAVSYLAFGPKATTIASSAVGLAAFLEAFGPTRWRYCRARVGLIAFFNDKVKSAPRDTSPGALWEGK